MATYTKTLLSASTNGKAIKVTATTSPGTTIHTAVSGTVNMDEVWLWARNISYADVKLSIQWGSEAADDLIAVTVAAEEGLALIVPGLLLQNSLIIKAFADAIDAINIIGFVNRITV